MREAIELLRNAIVAAITISILKRAADPDADAIITNSDITRILINPDK